MDPSSFYFGLPGNTLSGRLFSKLRTKALAVMLKICLGVKFTPSLAWKLNPPDMAPVNAMTHQQPKKITFHIVWSNNFPKKLFMVSAKQKNPEEGQEKNCHLRNIYT